MSENCTHDCSTCGAACASRTEPQDLHEKPNEYTNVKKMIGVVSGKGGVGKSMVTSLLSVLMQRQGYQIQAYPSATFASPPFAKMFFRDVENLNINTEGESVYDRDCQITRNFIADLDRHDSTKPFFSFVFYDLPHAIQISEDHQYHFQPSWAYTDYMELNNDTDPGFTPK